MEVSGTGAAAGVENVAPSDGGASDEDVIGLEGADIGFECVVFCPDTSLISRMVSMSPSMLPASGACVGIGVRGVSNELLTPTHGGGIGVRGVSNELFAPVQGAENMRRQ